MAVGGGEVEADPAYWAVGGGEGVPEGVDDESHAFLEGHGVAEVGGDGLGDEVVWSGHVWLVFHGQIIASKLSRPKVSSVANCSAYWRFMSWP